MRVGSQEWSRLLCKRRQSDHQFANEKRGEVKEAAGGRRQVAGGRGQGQGVGGKTKKKSGPEGPPP